MRVRAVKVDNGILIPYQEGLNEIQDDHLLLDIELVDSPPEEEDYNALDEIVDLCETGDSTASVEHDQRIYRR